MNGRWALVGFFWETQLTQCTFTYIQARNTGKELISIPQKPTRARVRGSGECQGLAATRLQGTLLAMASPSLVSVARVEKVTSAKPPAAAPGAANSMEIGQTFTKAQETRLKPGAKPPSLGWSQPQVVRRETEMGRSAENPLPS